MSTKKQVSRHRQVIDVPKKAGRDPRFSALSAGQADAFVQSKRYAFVPELLREEVKDLKARVAATSKAERTCKLWEKPKFTEEREALERTLAQTRTRLERAEREEREREVLASAKREERAKRKEGKGAWYMKDCELEQIGQANASSGEEGSAAQGQIRELGSKRRQAGCQEGGGEEEEEGRGEGEEEQAVCTGAGAGRRREAEEGVVVHWAVICIVLHGGM